MFGKRSHFYWKIPTRGRRRKACQGGRRPSEHTGAWLCRLVGTPEAPRVSEPSHRWSRSAYGQDSHRNQAPVSWGSDRHTPDEDRQKDCSSSCTEDGFYWGQGQGRKPIEEKLTGKWMPHPRCGGWGCMRKRHVYEHHEGVPGEPEHLLTYDSF